MVVPAVIIYIFWITYKFFNRTAPEENSKEETDLFNNNNKIV